MAAFLGTRESLQPSGMKRKRGRPQKSTGARGPGLSQQDNSDEEEFTTALVKKIKSAQETEQKKKAPPPPPVKQEPSSEEDDDDDDDDDDNDDDDDEEESATSGDEESDDNDDDDDDDEDDDDDDDDDEDEEEADDASVKTEKSTDTNPVEVAAAGSAADSDQQDAVWSQADTDRLLGNIELQLPPDDNLRYSLMSEKLDWEKIAFGQFVAEACHKQWLYVIQKLRKYRTMTELVADAKHVAKNPPPSNTTHKRKQVTHPDMPKKPLTPYFRYYTEKQIKYTKKHPELSMTDMSKLLGEKYNKMDQAKKQKYIDAFQRENEAYKIAMQKFQKEHPEMYDDNGHLKTELKPIRTPVIRDPGTKAFTPMNVYINSKTEEHMRKDPTVTKKQCYDLYRNKWPTLSENKRVKYINKACEAKKKYDEELEAHLVKHPDDEEKRLQLAKSVLTKEEQKLKDRYDGKPEKPPPNGYGLYSSIMLPLLTEIPSVKRMAEVSRKWKALSDAEKEKYNQQALERVQEYKVAYQKYLEGLPQDERDKLQEGSSKKKTAAPAQSGTQQDPAQPSNSSVSSTSKSQSAVSERTKPPASPMFVFINEKRDKYRSKHPHMDHQELTRLMAKEFSALSEDKKAKYKKMLDQMKAQNNNVPDTPDIKTEPEAEEKPRPQESRNSGKIHIPETSPAAAAAVVANHVSPNKKKKKDKNYPGEPRKPPGSGYSLFSTEMLVKLSDVPSNERMHVISQQWNSMTPKQKADYKKERDKIAAQYNKDLAKFKAKLSPEELEAYERHCEAQKPGSKKTTTTTASKPAPKQPPAKQAPAKPPAKQPPAKKPPVKEESDSETTAESGSEEEDEESESEDEESSQPAAQQNAQTSSEEEEETETEAESESASAESDESD